MKKTFSLLLLLSGICVVFSSNPVASLELKHPQGNITLEEIEKLKDDRKIIKVLNERQAFSQFVMILPEGIVVNEGGIITQGKVLKDTQTLANDQHRLLSNKNRDINTENPMYFKGKLAVISSPGSENWYHWLLQILPRLRVLAESKVEFDKIYINNLQFEWQNVALQHVLTFLNIPMDKILIVNGDCIVQAEQLIVPSVPFIPDKGTPLPVWMKTFLQDVFLKNTKQSNVHYSDKIFISRSRAKIRRILNETELFSYLETQGFQKIFLEDLAPTEQAKIFNTAKVIIGPHGSGFANLIFAKPGLKIIEIDHGTPEPRSFYKQMAAIMGCKYTPFYADNTTAEHLEDDMTVDIKKIAQFIELLGI